MLPLDLPDEFESYEEYQRWHRWLWMWWQIGLCEMEWATMWMPFLPQ